MRKREQQRASVAPRQRYWGRGLTIFEFAVVTLIFAILMAVLLERVVFYQQQAEQAAVQKLLGNMRSALTNRLLAAQARGEPVDKEGLARQNPISWLERPPENYGGEGDDLARKPLPAGHWYFDRTRHLLVYVFSGKKSFLGDAIERSYFKVESIRLPIKHAKPEGAHDQDGGVALIQVDGG
jgi:general secretion pathway protein G